MRKGYSLAHIPLETLEGWSLGVLPIRVQTSCDASSELGGCTPHRGRSTDNHRANRRGIIISRATAYSHGDSGSGAHREFTSVSVSLCNFTKTTNRPHFPSIFLGWRDLTSTVMTV